MGIDLTLRHLRVVLAVADAGGYTPAARELHVAQPSLSRTVQEVEQRIGVPLFERTTRRVSPTLEGEEFLAIARRLVGEFDTALNHFEGYLAGTRGAVSVAALPSLAGTMLPPVLAAFRRAHPEVSVTVKDGFSEEVLDLVVRGEVDLAVSVAARVPDSMRLRHIAVDSFAAVLPSDHPLASSEKLRWTDLAGHPFVAFERLSSIRSYVDRVLAETDTRIGTLTEARNIGAVAGLVAAGLGITAAPSLVLPMMTFADVVVRPLAEPVVERDICLIHDPRRPMSRAAQELMHLLVSAGEREIASPPGVRWVPSASDQA
ncbi:DNA-binding transcriptional LysR family regulator [Nocardioides luteus]|uniref:LysR family transcriptional regulator n=1 Tax=Nocardioides luteus TaxID=1844 RepID=A0ABQ5STX9_9ACTN|nr:LysR family transcriptional regulator [Nocardioides luteus]MDR7309210.1 DNA-binding transcriptional LysR family regulator [Nocardioides luteus]GGR49064.1 LysR family transcriptional regulator [Nocardioides luteus]GLJ67615.1 LysR family transcriptional regulator [Nocardioides luteus]